MEGKSKQKSAKVETVLKYPEKDSLWICPPDHNRYSISDHWEREVSVYDFNLLDRGRTDCAKANQGGKKEETALIHSLVDAAQFQSDSLIFICFAVACLAVDPLWCRPAWTLVVMAYALVRPFDLALFLAPKLWEDWNLALLWICPEESVKWCLSFQMRCLSFGMKTF